MKPYRNRFENRILVEGSEVELEPRVVTALGLSLHELATNAIKYGALSVTTGQVAIRWQVSDGTLVIDWHEEGGPAADAEAASGTGSLLIDGMLSSLKGSVERRFEESGLQTRISVPLELGG